MKNRFLRICLLAVAILCGLTACDSAKPTVSLSDDGYVMVNGEKTEYKAQEEGVKSDEITVEDGFLVVNGVKTEYEVMLPHTHDFNEWTLYGEGNMNCEDRLYSRICADCSAIEWKQGTAASHRWTAVTTEPTCQAEGYDTRTCNYCGKVETLNKTPVSDHAYAAYASDNSFHWQDCVNCDHTTEKAEHTVGENGICTVCDAVIGATEGIVYDLSSDGTYAVVIGYTGSAERIRIAEEYNGVPVTEICSGAFRETDITSVVIPDSVTSIGDEAFMFCSSLSSVIIPDSVTYIGDSAFGNCYSLTSVAIPDSVTSIGFYAFNGCSNLITEYEFCQYFGSEDNPYQVLLRVTNQNLSTYTIHEDTRIIAANAFNGCSRLSGVTIPNRVTSIGDYAFSECSSLTSVAIPDSVRFIGGHAFYICTSLTSVVIPNGVTHIGNQAFHSCSSLTSVVIGDGVTYIGDYAFLSLTSIYYTGIQEDWDGIDIGDNWDLTSTTRYYYAETAPADGGLYWRYVDGVPTPW